MQNVHVLSYDRVQYMLLFDLVHTRLIKKRWELKVITHVNLGGVRFVFVVIDDM